MNRSLKWMCVISLVLAVTANAQPLEQGDIIVMTGSNVGDTSAGVAGGSNQATVWALNLRGGYFVTPEIEVGGMFMGAWSTGADAYSIVGYGAYNFTQIEIGPENLVPYAGVFIGYIDPGANNGWVWGPMAGIKWFPFGADNILIFVEYQYQDIQDIPGWTDAHVAEVGFGILLP